MTCLLDVEPGGDVQLDRLLTCPLLCKFRDGPDSADFVQFLDQVVDMPVIVHVLVRRAENCGNSAVAVL